MPKKAEPAPVQASAPSPRKPDEYEGKFGKLIRQAKEHLDPDENILAAVMGSYDATYSDKGSWVTLSKGVLLATTKRLVFLGNKGIGYDLESFPYKSISSFDMSKIGDCYEIKFYSLGHDVKLELIFEGDMPGLIREVKERMDNGSPDSSQPVQVQQQVDILEQIEKLAELEKKGIITADEFRAKKKSLLDRI